LSTSSEHTPSKPHILTSVLLIKSTLKSLISEAADYELSYRKNKNGPKDYHIRCILFKICTITGPLNGCHHNIHQTREHNNHHLAVVHRRITHVVNPNGDQVEDAAQHAE